MGVLDSPDPIFETHADIPGRLTSTADAQKVGAREFNALRTFANEVKALVMDAAKGNSALDTRVTAAEGTLSPLPGQITAVEGRATAVEGRATVLEKRAAGTINVAEHGAVGDGVANDSQAIQEALEAIAARGGGTLDFGSGVYRIGSLQHSWTALLLSMESAATMPIRLVGKGAVLKHDADPSKTLLAIAGQGTGNATPWTMERFHVRGLHISGIKFVGTRTPSDTDIEATQGNHLLYLAYVEDAEVTGNVFENCNGAGIWYFARGLNVHGNRFRNANGGIQGSDSLDVDISHNRFRCYFKCDDQIGLFGENVTSKNFTAVGNVVDKGWDGLKAVGGTKRGWARCMILGGDVDGAKIQGNHLLNSNSSDATDRANLLAGGGFTLEAAVSGTPRNVDVIGNTFRNLRWGILGNAGESAGVKIRGNTFKDLELYAIDMGVSAVDHENSDLAIEDNDFTNCQSTNGASDRVIHVTATPRLSIKRNRLTECFGGKHIAVDVALDGGAPVLVDDVDVIENRITTSQVVAYPNGYPISIYGVNTGRVNRNRVSAAYGFAVQIEERGDLIEYSDNTLEGFTGNDNSFEASSVATGKAGAMLSSGNLTRPDGEVWAGRHLDKKLLRGAGTALANGNYPRYDDAEGYSPVPRIVGDATYLPTPGAEWRGQVVRTTGGTGLPDGVFVCLRDSTGAYVWSRLEATA